MTDTKPLFESLRNSADPQVVAAIENLIADGSDRDLCRVNVTSFAAKRGLDEEKAIGGMQQSVRDIKNDMVVKIGIHEGPCLAVTLNDRLDYFGQTVNIAARVQGLADSQAILVTEPVMENPQVAKMLEASKLTPAARDATLRGVADKVTIYQIPHQ